MGKIGRHMELIMTASKAFLEVSERLGILKEDWLEDPHVAATMICSMGIFRDGMEKHGVPMLESRSSLIKTRFMGLWGSCGFPVVDIDGKKAASYACTKIGEEAAEFIKAPFPAFVIRSGEPLFRSIRFDEERGDLLGAYPTSHLLIAYHDNMGCDEESKQPLPLWTGIIEDDKWNANPGYFHVRDAAAFCEQDEEPNTEYSDNLIDEQVAPGPMGRRMMDRNSLIMRRIIAGVCLELSNPGRLEAAHVGVVAKRREKSRKRKYRILPKGCDQYALRDSVKLPDFRETVRDYLDGKKRSSPKVRTLVRGHWKRQAYGPDKQLRKIIHVEPYWRGPKGAPISVRALVRNQRKERGKETRR